MDVAGRKLKELHNQYQVKSKEFDQLYEAFTKTSQVISPCIPFSFMKGWHFIGDVCVCVSCS